jgi:hypothetical protein
MAAGVTVIDDRRDHILTEAGSSDRLDQEQPIHDRG